MLEQIISLVAAAMILLAFLGNQAKWLTQDSWSYLWLNIAGSLILAVIAFRARQVGLTVLEGAWATISIVSFIKTL